ncbi:hypothetical protein ACFE04_021831 [Oxalis oulophora]
MELYSQVTKLFPLLIQLPLQMEGLETRFLFLGGGWNNDLWGGELPMASWIDDFTPDNPVWLSRMNGHMALANSAVLKLAGITNLSEDPSSGTIMRTDSREPAGLLIDAAMKLVALWIPDISSWRTSRASLGRLFRCVSMADSLGKMMIRACLFFPLETWERLHAFADGSLGSNSALFHEPYFDDPGNYGLQVTELDSLLNMSIASDKSDLYAASLLVLADAQMSRDNEPRHRRDSTFPIHGLRGFVVMCPRTLL